LLDFLFFIVFGLFYIVTNQINNYLNTKIIKIPSICFEGIGAQNKCSLESRLFNRGGTQRIYVVRLCVERAAEEAGWLIG